MTDVAVENRTREIVVEEVFPYSPETLWHLLTTAEIIGRWFMKPTDFEPVEGATFTFQTTPAGEWDGKIHCKVLEVVPNEKFSFAWVGGHEGNHGYGSPLDTVVTWTLARTPGGTSLRLVHSGFRLPRNETAYARMGEGWKQVVATVGGLAAEQN